jgi:hypothetical protein
MGRMAQGLGAVAAAAAIVVATLFVPAAGASGPLYPGTTVKTTTVTTKVHVSPSGNPTGNSGSAGVIPKGAPGTGGGPFGGSTDVLFAGAGLAFLAGVAALGLALGRRRPLAAGRRRSVGQPRGE